MQIGERSPILRRYVEERLAGKVSNGAGLAFAAPPHTQGCRRSRGRSAIRLHLKDTFRQQEKNLKPRSRKKALAALQGRCPGCSLHHFVFSKRGVYNAPSDAQVQTFAIPSTYAKVLA